MVASKGRRKTGRGLQGDGVTRMCLAQNEWASSLLRVARKFLNFCETTESAEVQIQIVLELTCVEMPWLEEGQEECPVPHYGVKMSPPQSIIMFTVSRTRRKAVRILSLLCPQVARWCNGKAFGLAISRSQVQTLPRQRCVTTLGKLFTPMCLCHQAV